MSGYLHEDIERELAVADSGLVGMFAGTIAETATAVTDKLPVLLDAFDPQRQFGPCSWPTRVKEVTVDVSESGESTHNVDVAQIVMPTRGDRCLVAFDDSEFPWIISWEPAA